MQALFYVAILFPIIVLFSLFTYFVPIGLWITAYFAGVKVAICTDRAGPGGAGHPAAFARRSGRME